MTPSDKKEFRKRRLFPRSLEEVVKQATQPLMDKQGKLYGALLRDWAQIVGPERAAVTRPQRLQFPANETSGAILHLNVRPAAAPELTYVIAQLLEQCARYFGYRAITRIVIHAAHDVFDTAEELPQKPMPSAPKNLTLNADVAPEMRDVLARLATHVGSAVVKKD